MKIKLYDIDYRAKDCLKLQNTKRELRNIIIKSREIDMTDFQIKLQINQYIKNKLKDNIMTIEALSNYKYNNYLLSPFHKLNEEYKQYITVPEKYLMEGHTEIDLIKRNKGDKTIKLNGEISLEQPINGKYKKTHMFTVHSFQGLTVDEDIYIDLRNYNEVTIPYTAISRAKRIEQLKIIM